MNTVLGALPPFGTPAGEVVRAALVGTAFTLIFAFAELWTRQFHPNPEWPRKFVHLAGGTVALGLPWLLFAGVVFGYCRAVSGGLALPVLMHFVHNAVMLWTGGL